MGPREGDSRLCSSWMPQVSRKWVTHRSIRSYSLSHESGCVIYTGPVRSWRYYCRFLLREKLGRSLHAGMQTNHTCDSPHGPCIAKAHLYEGTQQQNMDDRSMNGL